MATKNRRSKTMSKMQISMVGQGEKITMVILEALIGSRLMKVKPETKRRLKEFGIDIDGMAEPFQKIGQMFRGPKRDK